VNMITSQVVCLVASLFLVDAITFGTRTVSEKCFCTCNYKIEQGCTTHMGMLATALLKI